MTRYLFSKALLWLITATLLFVCFAVISHAQDTIKRPVHIGLVYPLSTNGLQAPVTENGISLHLLAGVSRQEDAFCLSGLAGIVKENATGVMLSGLYNQAGIDMKGLQLAGLANYTGRRTRGWQVSGLANISAVMSGVQLSGLANLSKQAAGVQLTGIANITDRIKGAQLSGCINAAQTAGVQAAGLVNLSQQTRAIQLAGLANIADTAGSQVAGLINIAKKVKGVQVAGFINIADSSDYPLGIVNIIRNGEQMLGVSVDEMGTTQLSFRSGSRFLYGILGVGYNFGHDNARYVLEAGLGAHFRFGQYFRLNTELSSSCLSDLEHDVYFKSTARVLAGLKLGNRLELFAGPSFNYLGYENDQEDIRNGHYVWKERNGSQYNGLFFGGTAGIQFRL